MPILKPLNVLTPDKSHYEKKTMFQVILFAYFLLFKHIWRPLFIGSSLTLLNNHLSFVVRLCLFWKKIPTHTRPRVRPVEFSHQPLVASSALICETNRDHILRSSSICRPSPGRRKTAATSPRPSSALPRSWRLEPLAHEIVLRTGHRAPRQPQAPHLAHNSPNGRRAGGGRRRALAHL